MSSAEGLPRNASRGAAQPAVPTHTGVLSSGPALRRDGSSVANTGATSGRARQAHEQGPNVAVVHAGARHGAAAMPTAASAVFGGAAAAPEHPIETIPKRDIRVLKSRDVPRIIGEGTFGTVQIAEYRSVMYAYKVGKNIEAIHREIRAQSRLSHENIVRVFFQVEGEHAFLMQLHRGSFWAALKADEKVAAKSWPLHQRLHVLLHVARALAYMHEQGMAHGDIKPDNIVLDCMTDSIGRTRGYLCDFDFASDVGAPHTNLCATNYTEAYAAPEVIDHAKGHVPECPDRKWADVYAFGVTLLQCLTGTKEPQTLLAQLDNHEGNEGTEESVNNASAAELLLKVPDAVIGSCDHASGDVVQHLPRQVMELVRHCTQPAPTQRCEMTAVVKLLEQCEDDAFADFLYQQYLRCRFCEDVSALSVLQTAAHTPVQQFSLAPVAGVWLGCLLAERSTLPGEFSLETQCSAESAKSRFTVHWEALNDLRRAGHDHASERVACVRLHFSFPPKHPFGESPKPSDDECEAILKALVARGLKLAMYTLAGHLLARGKGVGDAAPNPEPFALLRRSAMLGNAHACYTLASICLELAWPREPGAAVHESDAAGRAVRTAAEGWLHHAASLGHVEAMYDLGFLYEAAGEFDKAIPFYKSARACFHSQATYRRALMHRFGTPMSVKNPGKALAQLMQLTQAPFNYPLAQVRLALMYLRGEPDMRVAQSLRSALTLLGEAIICTKNAQRADDIAARAEALLHYGRIDGGLVWPELEQAHGDVLRAMRAITSPRTAGFTSIGPVWSRFWQGTLGYHTWLASVRSPEGSGIGRGESFINTAAELNLAEAVFYSGFLLKDDGGSADVPSKAERQLFQAACNVGMKAGSVLTNADAAPIVSNVLAAGDDMDVILAAWSCFELGRRLLERYKKCSGDVAMRLFLSAAWWLDAAQQLHHPAACMQLAELCRVADGLPTGHWLRQRVAEKLIDTAAKLAWPDAILMRIHPSPAAATERSTDLTLRVLVESAHTALLQPRVALVAGAWLAECNDGWLINREGARHADTFLNRAAKFCDPAESAAAQYVLGHLAVAAHEYVRAYDAWTAARNALPAFKPALYALAWLIWRMTEPTIQATSLILHYLEDAANEADAPYVEAGAVQSAEPSLTADLSSEAPASARRTLRYTSLGVDSSAAAFVAAAVASSPMPRPFLASIPAAVRALQGVREMSIFARIRRLEDAVTQGQELTCDQLYELAKHRQQSPDADVREAGEKNLLQAAELGSVGAAADWLQQQAMAAVGKRARNKVNLYAILASAMRILAGIAPRPCAPDMQAERDKLWTTVQELVHRITDEHAPSTIAATVTYAWRMFSASASSTDLDTALTLHFQHPSLVCGDGALCGLQRAAAVQYERVRGDERERACVESALALLAAQHAAVDPPVQPAAASDACEPSP